MLKEGMKTINAEFIRTRASSQLSFGQFRSYATSFPGLLLTLTLTWKSKMIPGTSLDLTPSFKTSVDAKVEGLVSNVDYLENWCMLLFKTNMAEKDACCEHTFLSLDCNFSFCTEFLHRWWLLKVKKSK